MSRAGILSRRSADQAILAGEISVNGSLISTPGTEVDPDRDVVEYKGKKIECNFNHFVYYAVYKPKGIISTAKDELGRKTVVDFVPIEPKVYPVGRLDVDSEGLMILTNDGDLTQKLTHPSFEHTKEYEIECRTDSKDYMAQGKFEEYLKDKFENGLMIEDKLTKADMVTLIREGKANFAMRVVLHTGYNRQIRKMCAKIGLHVIRLTRIRIGKLVLAGLNLSPGQYKKITASEIL